MKKSNGFDSERVGPESVDIKKDYNQTQLTNDQNQQSLLDQTSEDGDRNIFVQATLANNTQTQIASNLPKAPKLEVKMEITKKPIKPTQFVMTDQQKAARKNQSELDNNIIRRKHSPSRVGLQKNRKGSNESLYLNSASQQNLLIEGQQHAQIQISRMQSPPQTQGGANFLTPKKQEDVTDTLRVVSSQNDEHQVFGIQARSIGIEQQTFSVQLSEISPESTDLDKIGSRHYQDYFTSQSSHRDKVVEIEAPKTNFKSRNNSKTINVSNRRPSKMVNEFQTLKHDLIIEEIRTNNLSKLAKVMEPYLTDKNQSEAVLDLETQMKKRILPHSYESYAKQQRSVSPTELRRQAGGIAVRNLISNSQVVINDADQRPQAEESFAKRLLAAQVGRTVNSKTQVTVPKDIILMKLAQRQMELQQLEFKTERKKALEQTDQSLITPKRGLSLPPLQSEIKSQKNSNLNNSSSIMDQNPQTTGKHQGLLKLINQSSDLQDNRKPDGSLTGTLVGFHITDLLKQAIHKPGNNLQATIDYYKRSVKTDNELNKEKEILIKNYRFRVVDAAKEITPEDRKLMLLNKGTSIYVANSLIKPEIYRYSTKVSNTMADVFLEMQSKPAAKKQSNNYDALTFENQSESINLPKDQNESRGTQQNLNQQDGGYIREEASRNQDNQNGASSHQKRQRNTPFTANTRSQRVMSTSHSRGVSSGIYYEQEDLHAVILNQQKVDQWLTLASREIDRSNEVLQEMAYKQVNSDQNRYTLTNGQLAPLTHSEIANRMIAPKVAQLVLQPKLMSVDDLTAVSQFTSKPYMYLMRTITNPELRSYLEMFTSKTTKFVDKSTLLQSHQNPVVQVVDFQTQLEVLQVVRIEYTHLDPFPIQDINLSQDLFFEQDLLDQLIQKLKSCKEGEKIFAKTEFMFVEMGGTYQLRMVDVEVVGYNAAFRTFNLENRELGVVTTRSRFNLMLETDPPDFIEKNRQLIDHWKEQSQQFLRVSRLINAEMLKRYGNNELSEDTRRKILKRVGDITKYNRQVVERAVIQVEALYVYSLMKSALSSQRNDPFVKNMLINFSIAMDSAALEIQKQTSLVKSLDLHPGIMEFRFTAIKNELMKCSISMSNSKYMALPKLLYQITWDSIFENKDMMFITPIPASTLIQFGGPKYNKTIKQINEMVNQYPLNHTTWIEAQKVIQVQFQKLMKVKWAETIANKIWEFIKLDFDFETNRGFTMSQIDPNLVKIFYQIKSYQSTVLYKVFENGLRCYLRFLLSFALRNERIKGTKVVEQIRKADQVRLINEDPDYVAPPGTDINDLDLIPLQLKPLVKLQAEVQVSGKMRNRKYKVITVPELDQIHKDFLGVLKNLHDATINLKRVDALIFPHLDLKTPYIIQPDIKNNPKITFILKLIDKLLEQGTYGCKKQILQFQTYLSIFEKKVDGVILNLKKQSFALANEGSDQDEDALQIDVIEEEEQEQPLVVATQENSVKKTPSRRPSEDGGDDSYDEEEAEESDEEEGGQQGNMMAYKSVEIDETLMRQELEFIRNHRYSVMDNCAHFNDFGLLIMDNTPFKNIVIDHCLALEEELKNYLRNEFLDQMRIVTNEINAFKGRLDENVSSIDDVIALLAYIDTLKRQDNKVEEIADYIDLLAKKAQFIESLKILFPEETMIRYWHLRNWPRTIDTWIKQRTQQLLNQKQMLIEQMKVECNNVFEIVVEIKGSLKVLVNKGLRHIDEKKSDARAKMLANLFEALQPGKQTGLVPIEVPHQLTLDWLAHESNWLYKKFDPTRVEKMFLNLEQLKLKFDDLDRLTIMINKRQNLLGIERTDFREQKKILDDLKPLYDLWIVANSFKNLIVSWFEDPLSDLDSFAMETQIDEWLIELKRLQKNQMILSHKCQIDVLTFILDSLAYITKYQTLIKTTRVKGLNQRHWRSINSELGIVIEPQTTNLIRMIGFGLNNEERIKIIKGISDIAQKEYAIQMLTEQLDSEMRSVQFIFMNGPLTDIRVIKRLDIISKKFAEFMLRVQVIKVNPYMRNFFDKLLDIEKTCKQVIEIVQEFSILQNKWVYLVSIFTTGSISESLAYEKRLWSGSDRFYRNTIKQIHDQAFVYLITRKEGFLSQLRKQNSELDLCREGLMRFLEQKRQIFARLYFVSNEELLTTYGQQSEIVQQMVNGTEKSFIKNIFQGIDKLVFNESNQIVGLKGNDGEKVLLTHIVNTNVPLEKWLQSLESNIKLTLRNQIIWAYSDMDRDTPVSPEDIKELRKYKTTKQFQTRIVDSNTVTQWIQRWPGQVTYLCLQIWFSQKLSAMFQGAADKAKFVDQIRRQRQLQMSAGRPLGFQSDSDTSSGREYDSKNGSESDESLIFEKLAEEDEQLEVLNDSIIDEVSEGPPVEEEPEEKQPVVAQKPVLMKQGTLVVKFRSRLSVVERIMRFQDRFCLNDVQHPADVLSDIRSSVIQKIKVMIHSLNQKLKRYTYNSTIALITCCVFQRDLLQFMIDNKVFKVTDFEWEIQFKYVMDKLQQVFKAIFASDLEKKRDKWDYRVEYNELDIRLDVFNFSRAYGFEYLGNVPRIVITPLTLRAQRSMLLAMQYQFASAVEGPFGTGKTETVKDIGNNLARQNYLLNTSSNFEYHEMLKFIKGVCACGAWLLFDEFNRFEPRLMSYITQILTQIQNAVRSQVKLIYIDEQKISIDFESSIFITMNPGYAGRAELPVNLKNLFRPVQMVLPEWHLITEILLARIGFYQAQDLSKKIVHVQKLSNELMQKHSHVKNDFGLRAIRSIVRISEILKRQCQNLKISEMPDMITCQKLNEINWKEQKLINDVVFELSAENANVLDNQPQIYFGVPSEQIIMVQDQNENEGRSSKQLAIATSASQDIKVQNDDQMNATIRNQTAGAFSNDSYTDDDYEEMQPVFQGPFFDIAFKSPYNRQQRQIQSLYQQIGIEELNPTDEELEEYIVVKALKDFNNSKFAEEDHSVINSIITNVFSIKSTALNTKENFKLSRSQLSKQTNPINFETLQSDYGNLHELLQQYMVASKLDKNHVIQQKCYQLFEVTQVKTGCIVLGETQSAKSTMIQTLSGALNFASQNELKLRISQKRKERLIQGILSCPQVGQLLPPHAIKNYQKQIKLYQKQTQPTALGNTITTDHKLGHTQNSGHSADMTQSKESQNSGFIKTKKQKLSEKQKQALLLEIYQKTKLDRLEIFQLEQELVLRGVQVKRINPKSITRSEFIGLVKPDNGVWQEGLFTSALRQFSNDLTSQKKWIHLDGPIDHQWAENLNSLLDENMKLDLPNGEILKVNDQTCIIFETDSLRNLTPSTISRCGLIHINRSDVNTPKYIFNQYLSRLPPNLSDNVMEIEAQVNQLMPSCFIVFKEEKERGLLTMPWTDEFWLIQSFIKIFDSFMHQYWIDYINGNKSDWEDAPQQNALKNCLLAHGYKPHSTDLIGELQEDTVKLDPEELEAEFKGFKLASATNNQNEAEFRMANNDISSNDSRIENSLKFLPLWIEAFIITALTLSFGPVLNKSARNRLSEKLKVKYEERRSDFATYQKLKKKIQLAKEEQRKKEAKLQLKQTLITMNKSGMTPKSPSSSDQGSNQNSTFMNQTATQKTFQSELTQQSTSQFTPNFQEPAENQPKAMFITEFPFNNDHGLNIFDYYFNLDTNQWTKFDNYDHQNRLMNNYAKLTTQMKSVTNISVPTLQQIKMYYLMECLVMTKKPIMVAGQGATGKSQMIKDMIYIQTGVFTQKIKVDHISCTLRTTQIQTKNHITRNLKTQKAKVRKVEVNENKDEAFIDSDTEKPMQSVKSHEQLPQQPNTSEQDLGQNQELLALFQNKQKQNKQPKVICPHGHGNSLLVYFEDVHLTKFDQFQDNSVAETLRDLIQYSRWFDSNKRQMRQVSGVNIICCLNTSDTSQNFISQRLLRQFSTIGLEVPDTETCFSIITKMLEIQVVQWPSQIQNKLQSLTYACIDLYKHCNEYLRPTPIKVQYTFNHRELFRLIASVCKVESNYINSVENLTKIFYHEAMRQFGDRILMKHDLRWFNRCVKSVCCQHFLDKDVSGFDFQKILTANDPDDHPMFENFPVKDPQNLWFSVLNSECEGYYSEVTQHKAIFEIIERQIQRYNEQPEIKKLNLVLFEELFNHLFRIIRAISIHGGHLIIVGLSGYATGQLVKLATFITSKLFSQLELHPEYSDSDWTQELRQKLITTSQDDKQMVFYIQESRLNQQDWYRDIECIMTCNNLTAVFGHQDIPTILGALKLQQRRLDRQKISGIKGNLDVDGLAAIEEGDKQSPTKHEDQITLTNLVKENIKVVQQNPSLANQLYLVLQERIRKNLHFVMTFTPTGKNFRDKMQLNSQLMCNSQIIWIQNLHYNDLVQIGNKLFTDAIENEQIIQQMHDANRDKRLDDYKRKQERQQNRKVLEAFVQIYLTTLDFSTKYFEKHKHRLYFTPSFFLRSLTGYRRLLAERKRNVEETMSRYRNGLDRIRDSLSDVQDYLQILKKQTPVLQKQQKNILAVAVEIQAQIQIIEEQKQQALQEETLTTQETAEAKKKLDECQYALDSIIPALNNSMQQIQKITKYEIAEVRSMQRPPRLLKIVMKAICILLDVEPQNKVTKEGKNKLSYWRAAISPLVLADPNFQQRLENFDKSSMTNDKMEIIEELMSDPDYSYEAVKKSSFAASNLYGWVKSLRDYHYIFKELEPRKNAFLQAEKVFKEATNRSNNKRNQIKGQAQQIENLNAQLAEKTKLLNELKDEIQDQITRASRAESLIRGLNAEKQKWIVCDRMLQGNSIAVVGDVALAAAIITYGGGFTFSFRKQLIEKWQDKILTPAEIQTTPNFSLIELFGDNLKIREWHSNGLGQDVLSITNALIIEKTKKQYITCIDPQQQASVWLKAQNTQQGMIITNLDDPNFKRTIEVAIEVGKLVMVENVPEDVNIQIESLVRQEITKHNESLMIKFCRKIFKLDKGFGVILVTNLSTPHFNVNMTNYCTLVNFYITIEGLSQSLLNLVVANERKDLLDNSNTSLNSTFDSVKALKDIENQILQKLANEKPHETLSDDHAINMLKESAATSESIALHLRKITQTNDFLEKARIVYTPVAFRAATLYFGIQDLHKVNPMYKYSLSWFTRQFQAMLNLVNMLNKPKQNPQSTVALKHKVTIQHEEFVLMDVQQSPEYRVDLLIKTFTQEILKKVTLSVFQQDRQFITYFLALRILQTEMLTDNSLISFSMAGSKVVTDPNPQFKAQNKLPWLSDVMLSDLQQLQQLKPFTNENTIQHILSNQEAWNQVYQATSISFETLPNSHLLDLHQFSVVDIRDAVEQADQQFQITLTGFGQLDTSEQNEGESQQVNTKEKQQPPKLQLKQYTEEEILADEDIWLVSEGDDEEYLKQKRNAQYYDDIQAMTDEEKQMARYMTERAPGSVMEDKDFSAMHMMTKKERKSYELRQLVLQRTVELALARCIRPDLIQACLHALTATIYDFSYAGFQVDIVAKFIDADGTHSLRPGQQIEMPIKEKSDNNIQRLIEEAHIDSSAQVPVLFFISHSVNVLAEMQQYHSGLHLGVKLNNIHCSKGAENQFQSMIRSSTMNGDWLLVQNLHLEPSWIKMIEVQIQQLNSEVNPKFRLWMTIPNMDDCSESILKDTIKIALEQPINIKMKLERHLSTLKEGIFKRGQESGVFHKNVFLGLCYLHAVLDGRRVFGPFGWHVAYEFDKNDFDISDSILQSYIKKDFAFKQEYLKVFKHIFANINFAGKINRIEDQRKLQAHIDDLFNEDISFNYETSMNVHQSHFGFPSKDQDLISQIMTQLPNSDQFEIFGFNQNIYRHNQRLIAQSITNKYKLLNLQQLQNQGYANTHTDLDNQLKRFSLEKTGRIADIDKPDSLTSCFIKLQKLLQKSSLDQTIVMDSDRYDQRIDKEYLPKRDLNDRAVSTTVKQIKQILTALITPNKQSNFDDAVAYCIDKEITDFTNLRDVMIKTLDQFLVYVEGVGVMPQVTEMLWHRIQTNQIPQTWISASYDTAHQSLAHYLFDFVNKVSFWNQYLQNRSRVYQISAFYNPRQLLHAIKLQYAQSNQKNVRSLRNCFTVAQSTDPQQVQVEYQNELNQGKASLLYGLWIEGADWDTQTQMLVEQKSFKIQQRFPVIVVTQTEGNNLNEDVFIDNPELTKQERKEKKRQIKAEELARKKQLTSKGNTKHVTPAKTPMMSGDATPKSPFAQTVDKVINQPVYTYKCPVFYSCNRLSLGGVSQDNKALFYVELKSHQKPGKWVKRSVALLLESSVLE